MLSISQKATGLAARHIFNVAMRSYTSILPPSYENNETVESLVRLFDQIPQMELAPFISEEEMQTEHLLDVRSSYNSKFYYFVDKIERFNKMRTSKDLNEIVSLVMKSGSLNLKAQRTPTKNYLQMLNRNLSKEPAFRAPKKVTFKEKVAYKEVMQEDDVMQNEFIKLPSDNEEEKSLSFGLERDIELYHSEKNLVYRRRLLLKIASQYDCIWKTNLIEKVRNNKINTLNGIEMELAITITTFNED